MNTPEHSSATPSKEHLFFLEKYLQIVSVLCVVLVCTTCTLSGIAVIAGKHEVLPTEPLALPQEIVMLSTSVFNGAVETDFARSIQIPLLSREDFMPNLIWPSIALDGTTVFDSGGPYGIPGYLLMWSPESQEIVQLLDEEVLAVDISQNGRFLMYYNINNPDAPSNFSLNYNVMDLDGEFPLYRSYDDNRRFRGWTKTNLLLFSNEEAYFFYDPMTQLEHYLFNLDELPGVTQNMDAVFVQAVEGAEVFYVQTDLGTIYRFWRNTGTFDRVVGSGESALAPFSVSPNGQYYFYMDGLEVVMLEVQTGNEWLVPEVEWVSFVTNNVVTTTTYVNGTRILRNLLLSELPRQER